jgi:hypothetical protein
MSLRNLERHKQAPMQDLRLVMDSDLNLQEQRPSLFTRLFKLPLELRCNIYEEVLVSPKSLELVHYFTDPLPPPALLQTCRVIRREAQPVYYGQNTFVVQPCRYEGRSSVQRQRESTVELLNAWLMPLQMSKCLHLVRRINIVNVFWTDSEPLTDIKEVNFALAKAVSPLQRMLCVFPRNGTRISGR